MNFASLVSLIKKNGAGIVALAIVFMMVYSWFPKMEKTLQTAIDKVNGTMTEVTREFRLELKAQREEATRERYLMWELLRTQQNSRVEPVLPLEPLERHVEPAKQP